MEANATESQLKTRLRGVSTGDANVRTRVTRIAPSVRLRANLTRSAEAIAPLGKLALPVTTWMSNPSAAKAATSAAIR
ncbi:MAG: hypothetical protein NVS2B8_03220 [Vulcanimicrobiaceae bacterium]